MFKLLHKLLSVCLAVALGIVPLPVFASAVTAGGCDHMQMTAMDNHGDHQQPACKHCQSHACEDGSCASQDCSSCFSNLIGSRAFSFGTPTHSEHPAPLGTEGLLSRSDPPPLRPPL